LKVASGSSNEKLPLTDKFHQSFMQYYEVDPAKAAEKQESLIFALIDVHSARISGNTGAFRQGIIGKTKQY
jgi:hypothetical protein